MSEHYFFYVLLCADHTLYGGFTNDVAHRFHQHEIGKGAKYTRVKSRHPLKLIYSQAFDTKSAALKAEYAFKHQPRSQKIVFLAQHGVVVE